MEVPVEFQWHLCVPQSCSSDDIHSVVNLGSFA